jgi:hypothetical protein
MTLDAGETIRFSDDRATPRIEYGTKKDHISPFDNMLDRDSSLSSVPALPFSPATPSARPLTAKEKQLLKTRTEWIKRKVEDVSLTQKNANQAFGVREYSVDDLKQKPKGNLLQYVEQVDESRRQQKYSASTGAGTGADSKEEGERVLSNDPEEPSEDNPPPSSASEAVGLEDGTRDKDSGVSGLMLRGRETGGLFEESRESFRSVLGQSSSSLLKGSASGLSPLRQESARAVEFRKILNFNPGDGSSATPAPGVAVTDPINFHPDLTRQEINPIIGRTTLDAGATQPRFSSESLQPVTSFGLSRPGLVESAPFRPAAPSLSGPSFPGIQQPETRRPQPPPLVLEFPRRAL